MAAHPIFFDPTKKRAATLSLLGVLAAVASTIVAIAFVASVLIVAHVEGPVIVPVQRSSSQVANQIAKKRELLPVARQLASAARARVRSTLVQNTASSRRMPRLPFAVRRHAHGSANRPLAIGFYVTWDDSSYASLQKALPKLDWVVPSWIELTGPAMTPRFNLDDKSLDLMRRVKPDVSILPMLQNATDGTWDGPGLAQMLADPDLRRARLDSVAKFVEAHSLQGVVVDFEEVPPEAQKNAIAFLEEMRALFKPRGWLTVVATPLDDDDWPYAEYANAADYQMLMAYDEHYEEGEPGSIASQGWFVDMLSRRMKQLDPAHTIVAIGNYGYDWSGKNQADDITFQEGVLSARDSQATIAFDSHSLNPHFAYSDDDGVEHQVWFLDAVTAFNQIRAADVFHPAGYALWRLGSEDPSIWPLFGRNYNAPAPDELKTIAPGNDIDFEGEGEILKVAAEPAAGARTFTLDSTHPIITSEAFTKIPTSYVIRRTGAVEGKVALTFDDGPSAEWTPKILGILKEKGVHATFFVTGTNGETNPRLIQRILADGNELGNHTFTHPNLGETSDEVTRIELNATQRLVEALTGRSMRLLRPPYLGDAEPTTPDEIVPIKLAQSMGYVSVGLKVDPDDWQQPPADVIVKRVLDGVTSKDPEKRGHVVLLHDAGGNRSQTVEALPQIIDALRARGLDIVPVSELAGWTRDQVMPPVPAEDLAPLINRFVFVTASWFQMLLRWVFMLAIGLGLARLVILCGLAAWNRRREARMMPPILENGPSVSVIIPAHNEEKVIADTVQRILDSDYPLAQIIVVDDGSTDGTAAVVRDRFADDKRVALITVPNGGKAKAINAGLERARGDVVVALDADTQFEKATIARLARWFADPEIGAVAGNAKVGNRINMLTRWQALEYITAQNLERRALSAVDCITVVPGAVGAWRRGALVKLGGFPGDTLAEDQDLTIAIQKAGYKAVFDAEAVAWTEAPATIRTLARQRFRWSFGTLQCLWKHRDAFLKRRYGALGLIALPQVWLFQIVLGLVAPFVDLMLIFQAVSALMNYLHHGQQFDPTNVQLACFYYAVFMTVDMAAAVFAFAFEKGEDEKLLWWLALQRFGYRQLTYYVLVKSLHSAAKGHLVGWGHIERAATVKPIADPAE
jgi:cellulose synthase/poly-beta-1,6-N-acetylglucosamine synthase-like glycosyltransferase/peptidoglycan/xylan/chitin deacetylase (PgdA/CDA1 family)